MDEDKFWPPREIVEAIPEQALLVCRIIRETLHTTAADSVGKLPFGTNPIPGILTELNKLTYLFYGRTLEDYEADRNRALAWPLADWIIATPSPLELPMISKLSDQECEQILVPDSNEWTNPIPAHIESLFFGLNTLRCYFGQLTWSRGQWIREGKWLREQVAGHMGIMGGAALSGAEWFQSDFCRHPTHILRPPERYLSPNQQKAWPIMPDEINRCGTHEQPKTDGLPVAWLEGIETRAKHLSIALTEVASEKQQTSPTILTGDNAIRASGSSPLTNYITMLLQVSEKLERCLDRDAEAMRILEAYASSEAIAYQQRRDSARRVGETKGKIIATPRIWTRRDKRRLIMLRGLEGGAWPACRAARYISWLQPSRGQSLHDQWFRRTIDEARQDNMAETLGPKLAQAKAVYTRMLNAAREVTQDEPGRADFDAARIELMPLISDLMDYSKLPQKQAESEPGVAKTSAPEQSSAPLIAGELTPNGITGLRALMLHYQTFNHPAIHAQKFHDGIRAEQGDALATVSELERLGLIEGKYDSYQCATVFYFGADFVRSILAVSYEPVADKNGTTNDNVSQPKSQQFTVNEDLSQVRIDGKSHDVSAEAARMAKLLLDANGEWVPMAKNGFTKPSNTKDKLPEQVQMLIETSKGKGYRIKQSS